MGARARPGAMAWRLSHLSLAVGLSLQVPWKDSWASALQHKCFGRYANIHLCLFLFFLNRGVDSMSSRMFQHKLKVVRPWQRAHTAAGICWASARTVSVQVGSVGNVANVNRHVLLNRHNRLGPNAQLMPYMERETGQWPGELRCMLIGTSFQARHLNIGSHMRQILKSCLCHAFLIWPLGWNPWNIFHPRHGLT